MHTTLITTEELAARLGASDLVVCDVRHDLAQPDSWGEAEYRSAHIPGALFVHLDRDLSARKTGTNGRHPLPTPKTTAALFGRLGIDSSKQVVVYDQGGGMLAARLWWMLKWLGHDAAALLDGGFAKWVGEARTTNADVAVPHAALFTIRRVKPTVNATGVAASLARRSLTLIDARVPERFRGEIEPLDPVAGHIPGARNRPYASNLKPDGTFKPPAALREEFTTLLAGTPASDVVHQCGSGVTACHNLLAMEVAGLPTTRLYPGSWSEWCADPARPVARDIVS